MADQSAGKSAETYASAERLHWEQRYQSDPSAASFSWTQSSPQVSLDMIGKVLPAGSDFVNVVDLGGGSSSLALHVSGLAHKRGIARTDVTVFDISQHALDAARVRMEKEKGDFPSAAMSSVHFQQADIRELELAPQSVDIWHDRAVFHFLTDSADRSKYIALAASTIKPGGALVIATFDEDGGPEKCSGLPVQRWSCAGLAEAFAAHGFSAEHCEKQVHTTPGGATQRFVYATLCKLPSSA